MHLHTDHTKNKPGETVFGFLMLAFSLFLLWQAYEIAGFSALSSPGAFPMAAAAIMVVTSIIICIQNLKLSTPSESRFFKDVLPPVVITMIVLVAIFSAVIDSVGFILTAFVFLVISIKYLYRHSWPRTIYLTVIILATVYVLFRLIFEVVLPEGIVPEREILAAISDLFRTQGK